MSAIPKIIHHVWPGGDPFRPEFHAFRRTWFDHHPDWTMMFWRTKMPDGRGIDRADVRTIIDRPEYSVVIKSDILRLYALHKYGGLYVDTDFECLKPFDDLITKGSFFCGREDDEYLCPSLMGSSPGHFFVGQYLNEALVRLAISTDTYANAHTNKVTGPYLLTELARRDPEVVTVYPKAFFYPFHGTERHRLHEPAPDSYAKHHWHGSSKEGWLGKQQQG
jgi:inositol phosphorylceramide mannosyltransferase catalytic subunit